jgi:hypothetical protein
VQPVGADDEVETSRRGVLEGDADRRAIVLQGCDGVVEKVLGRPLACPVKQFDQVVAQ